MNHPAGPEKPGAARPLLGGAGAGRFLKLARADKTSGCSKVRTYGLENNQP